MTKRRRLYLGLLSMSHGLNHVYQLLTPVMIPKITEEYGLSNLMAGLLLASFSLSYSLLQFPVGYLSRRLGRKNLLILGFVTTSFSFMSIAFADNVAALALVLFLAGVGGSTYHPNGMPLLSEYYEENRGQASGFHQTGGALGSFIAPLLIGVLMLNLSWRLTTTTLSVLGIILSVILYLLLTEPRPKNEEEHQPQPKKSKLSMGLYGPALVFILTAMIYVTGLRGIDAFANQYFTYGRGIQNIAQASFLFSMLKVAGLFSGPISGKLSDIFGRKKLIIILILIESASLYILTVTPVAILMIPCIVFGFSSFGLLAITDAFLADLVPQEHRGTIFGLNFTLSFVTAAIIPPILGGVIDLQGFNTGFIALSITVLFSIPILTQIRPRNNKTERQPIPPNP